MVRMMQLSKTGGEQKYVSWWLESQREREDMKLHIAGMQIEVRHDVFSPDPAETFSTGFMLQCFPSLHRKTVLDLGCGCGVLAMHAVRQGASHVVAVDQDDAAIRNTRENVAAAGMIDKVVIKQADLFDHVSQRFDVVLANLPIADVAWPQVAGGPQSLFARFIERLPSCLTEGGACYLCFASFGDVDGFDRLIRTSPFRTVLHGAEKLGVNWYVVKLTL
jgi:16S rRNA G1207 methylase RsmC